MSEDSRRPWRDLDRTVLRPGVDRGLAELRQAVRAESRRVLEDTAEWPAPRRRVHVDDRMRRPTTSDAEDVLYEQGWRDGQRAGRRLAMVAIAVAVLWLVTVGVVLARLVQVTS